jgi:formate dehydrogenase subunit gamma
MESHVSAQEIRDRSEQIATDLARLEGPLLPILHAVQHEFGYVPQDALKVIAQTLNLSRAEVHGVMTFYHDFREQPAGRHVLKICRAEACQSMGGDEIAERARGRLGLDWHETAADGSVTLEPVYCLGLCACAPAAMLDGRVIGRFDEQRLDEIIKKVSA